MLLFKHSFVRTLTAFSLAVILFFGAGLVPASVVQAESISDLKAQLAALEEREEKSNARLDELRKDTNQKRAYRDELKEKIDTVQQQLDTLVRRIDVLDDQIRQGEQDIEAAQLSINENFECLKDRLRAIYMAGEASSLAIIFSSTSLADYTQKSEMLQAVTEHDTQLLETLETQMHAVEDTVQQINDDKEELSESKKELDAKSVELSALYEESQKLLEEAEANEAEAKAEADRIAREKEETDAAIDEWYEEYYAALEAANRNAGYVGTGNFVWPMPGYTYITCYYGSGGHRGIDIAGSGIYGRPIVAADGGTVIYSGWMGSYGYCVFIDHGNGFSTRYAHASALACSVGDYVLPGQTIAYVGSTGNSTGPHLHFEVLYNGSLQDPFRYF